MQKAGFLVMWLYTSVAQSRPVCVDPGQKTQTTISHIVGGGGGGHLNLCCMIAFYMEELASMKSYQYPNFDIL